MVSVKKTTLVALLLFASSTAVAREPAAWYANAALRLQLDTSVRSFFGSEKGQFVALRGRRAPGGDPRLVATQFLGVLDGVPLDRVTTKYGYTLYSGCQPHNCAVTAAVLTKFGSTVVNAAVLIHWRCARADLPLDSTPAAKGGRYRVGGCDDALHPTVTVFVARKAAADERQIQALKDWAEKRLSAIAGDRKARYETVALQ